MQAGQGGDAHKQEMDHVPRGVFLLRGPVESLRGLMQAYMTSTYLNTF